MKIQKFLISVQDILLDKPDISIKTIRLIIKSFENCLSNKEIEKESNILLLRVIREIGIKQISIETSINNINYEKLQNEFNHLAERKK